MTPNPHALALSKEPSHSYAEIRMAVNKLVNYGVGTRENAEEWVTEWAHDPEVTDLDQRVDDEIYEAAASQ
jgi:hypothetical protein